MKALKGINQVPKNLKEGVPKIDKEKIKSKFKNKKDAESKGNPETNQED